MKIIHVSPSIDRNSGGVGEVIRHLRHAQQNAGEDARIVTLAQSASPGHENLPQLTRLASVGASAIGFSPLLIETLTRAAPDIIHSHGLWMYPSYAAFRSATQLGIPEVISPHGMLDAWALRNAAWKKRIVRWLFESRHLSSAACLHALCEPELAAIRDLGLTNPVCIIPNGVDTAFSNRPFAPKHPKTLLYLGRIHPKKGLTSLIQAWGLAADHARAHNWTLRIVGWDQSGYQEQLQSVVARLAIDDLVDFAGPLYDEDKHRAMRESTAFILPSHSEGLPMTVLEAWANSLPCLLTPACNLPIGYDAGAAFEITTEPTALAGQLKHLFSTSPETLKQMGQAGLTLARDEFGWGRIARQFIDVYAWLRNTAPRPDCVDLHRING